MEHIHRKTYDPDHEFIEAELKAANPKKTMKSSKLHIYNDADVHPGIVPLKRCHSNMVKSWKKVSPWFLPHKLMNRGEVIKHGNPSRCTKVNALVELMIKMEVARQGVRFQIRQTLINHK